jgi:hypothetical protein
MLEIGTKRNNGRALGGFSLPKKIPLARLILVLALEFWYTPPEKAYAIELADQAS